MHKVVDYSPETWLRYSYVYYFCNFCPSCKKVFGTEMYDFIHNLIDHNIIMQDQTVSNIRNPDLIFTSF